MGTLYPVTTATNRREILHRLLLLQRLPIVCYPCSRSVTMSESKFLKMALTFFLVTIVVLMTSSNHLGAEARYLPTRSDPLAPIGPPRGEDPRFDRLYDIIKELLRNGAGDTFEDRKYIPKSHYDTGMF